MLKTIFETNKNIYLRPLDMELAVGGCHVNFLYENGEECEKFKSGCNKCPQLNFFNIFNISNKILKRKKIYLINFNQKYYLKIILLKNYTIVLQ